MSRIQVRSFREPDETLTPPLGKSAIVRIGEVTVERGVLQPGWSWRQHVKPIVRTERCRFHHRGVVLSGQLGIRAGHPHGRRGGSDHRAGQRLRRPARTRWLGRRGRAPGDHRLGRGRGLGIAARRRRADAGDPPLHRHRGLDDARPTPRRRGVDADPRAPRRDRAIGAFALPGSRGRDRRRQLPGRLRRCRP
jgi:hypothetical protein